ncbi:MAG: hypothetical protein A2028_03535 [Candidatus Aminicenantes bacterium RBG_19FT_COMBO_59_29]|jgi:hypothetical protein|nr:MAG: hypothetical protein A2028_03535 [Candidatus Aminicenantes bacterium RBG_19FT_COMBO_59_29]
MGKLDRALLSIGDDKDDINLNEQPAEKLHLLKLFSVQSGENGDRIRFDWPPESFPQIIQSFEEFYFAFRDHLMNCRFKSFFILTIPT